MSLPAGKEKHHDSRSQRLKHQLATVNEASLASAKFLPLLFCTSFTLLFHYCSDINRGWPQRPAEERHTHSGDWQWLTMSRRFRTCCKSVLYSEGKQKQTWQTASCDKSSLLDYFKWQNSNIEHQHVWLTLSHLALFCGFTDYFLHDRDNDNNSLGKWSHSESKNMFVVLVFSVLNLVSLPAPFNSSNLPTL